MTTFIVCGMHRSGTSVTARVLQALGLPTGEPLLGPDAHNVHGHFEVAPITLFNDELFQKFGGRWCEPSEALRDEATQRLVADEALGGKARTLWEEHMPDGNRFIKDPRMSLLLPFWERVIDDELALIICFRKKEDVVASILDREPYLLRKFKEKRDQAFSELWANHLLTPAAWASMNLVPYMFSHFMLLTGRPEDAVRELARFVAYNSDWVPRSDTWLGDAVAAVDPQQVHQGVRV